MIEVEVKFLLEPAEEQRLLDGALLTSERTFSDVYYDTDGYILTTTDRWLRARAGTFELKLPAGGNRSSAFNQYQELTTEGDIRRALGLAETDADLAVDLKNAGYEPFVIITTNRKKFKKGEFTIDLDSADFGYNLAEVELLVPSDAEQKNARNKIAAFAREHGLQVRPVKGKLLTYIERYRPDHFRRLQEAGVIWS